jgi:hypothetical protein
VPKARRKMKGVPATVDTRSFRDVFDGYLTDIARVHGPDTAETYAMLREGEVTAMRLNDVDYPDSSEQAQDFLSLRLDHSGE